MFVRWSEQSSKTFSVSLIALSLCACSTTPDLGLNRPAAGKPEFPAPNVKQIEEQIACEVRQTVFDNQTRFSDTTWAAVATLTLQVDVSGQLSPTLSFIDPLKLAGTSFAFGVGATASDARQRIFSETVTIPVKPILDGFAKDQADLTAAHEGKIIARPICGGATADSPAFSGDFGIAESATAALTSVTNLAADPGKTFKSSNAFGETVQFVVVLGASGIGPTWTLKDFKGPGGFAGISKTNTQKLVISFGSAKPNGAGGILAGSLLSSLMFPTTSPSGRSELQRYGSQDLVKSLSLSERNVIMKTYGLKDEGELRALVEAKQAADAQAATDSAVQAAQDENLNMLLQSLHTLQ